MAKAAKIDDVKKPAPPAPTSRPILVVDKSEAPSDPMLATAGSAAPTGPPDGPSAGQPITHSAKTIQPLDTNLAAPEAEQKLDETDGKEHAEEAQTESLQALKETASEEKPDPEPAKTETASEPAPDSIPEPTKDAEPSGGPKRDNEAAATAEETAALEAQAARNQELEGLIASGKYAVPVDAVHRKRTHVHSLLLVVLALALILVLADAVLDIGLVSAPDTIPHTSFFSTK